MEKIDQNTFFTITKHFDVIPYSQTESWVMAQSDNDPLKLLFLVDNTSNPKIGCIAHIKKKCGLKMLLIEAERREKKIFKSSTIRCFYEELRQLGFDAIEINSCLPYSSEYEIGIRQAGFLRPVGLFSVQLTSYIHLDTEIKYDHNWKRNLKKAETFGLTFEIINKPISKDIQDFLELYNEMISRKKVPSTFTFNTINTLLVSNYFQLFFIKNESGKRIATIIIYKVRSYAGGLYAASGKLAHDCAASFYLYDNLLQYLAQNGILIFDMAKLAPSTHSTNSVFIFKNGIKGEYVLVNGEWSWYKNNWLRPLMYVAKKLLWKKIEV